ncbi:MAG: hypothetical protein ACOY45_07825 [Pseudomonadota bacterium]
MGLYFREIDDRIRALRSRGIGLGCAPHGLLHKLKAAEALPRPEVTLTHSDLLDLADILTMLLAECRAEPGG